MQNGISQRDINGLRFDVRYISTNNADPVRDAIQLDLLLRDLEKPRRYVERNYATGAEQGELRRDLAGSAAEIEPALAARRKVPIDPFFLVVFPI